MTRAIEVVTAPAYEPVSLADMRAWCRIGAGVTDHDTELGLLRKAMREHAENYTHRALVQRTLKLYLDDWPAAGRHGTEIRLPFPPLRSVSSFKYTDTDGTLTTLAADQYVVHDEREPAIIVPAWQVTWPTIRVVPDSLQITFVAGYAAGSPSDEASNQESIPASVKLWMAARAATLFENREQLVSSNQVKIPHDFCDAMLDSLIVGTRLF